MRNISAMSILCCSFVLCKLQRAGGLSLPSCNQVKTTPHVFTHQLSTRRRHGIRHWSRSTTVSPRSKNSDTEEQNSVMVEPGSENDVFTKDQWDDIQEGQPSQLSVMKELLGVNIFTYILAFLILTFGSLNIILGPGWLGGTLGIQGTGNIQQVSPSLPDTMDLSKDEYLL